MGMGVWEKRILVFVVFLARLTWAVDLFEGSSHGSMCPKETVSDSIFGFPDRYCLVNGQNELSGFVAVTEGDEVCLQRALNMVHKKDYNYVAVLFYASWCPFSKTFRPTFSALSSLYPSIPHFAFEEAAIRPSTLSKYGVHGFPTLVLLNSTMRVRYPGNRTLGSVVDFYSEVTGIQTTLLDELSLESVGRPSSQEKQNRTELDNCPFPWARSPENLLRQETYLTLATAFVLLRLIYLFFPTLSVCAHYAWSRRIRNMRLENLWGHPLAYLNKAIQLFSSLKEPYKRRNLQEGAMNARAWASKSLATVSIGDGGSRTR